MKKLILIIMLSFSFSLSQKVAVVVNPNIKDISKEEVKELLLGIKRTINGHSNPKIILSKDKKINKKAIEKLLGISYENFKVYWFEKALAGEGNIPKEMNYRKAIREIKRHKGSIGILPADKIKRSGLKVIMVFE